MQEKLSCETLIVGGGLSGLACAQLLDRTGVDWLLVEKDESLGGRVQSDATDDGFLLDRGFQVLNSAYPALHQVVDVDQLKLGEFANGAEVFLDGRLHKIGDPLRRLEVLFPTLLAPVGSLSDKLKILKLVCFCQNPANHSAVAGQTTEEFLAHFGFSNRLVESFFRPFFGGIFLEEELLTTAQKFVTLFSYLSQGGASLPAEGMGALPKLMAAELAAERILTGKAVTGWNKGCVETEGLKLKASTLVLAGWEVQALLMNLAPPACHTAHTHYFARDKQNDRSKKYLKLNGSSTGLVQTVAINSAAQPTYAPPDFDLMTISTRGQASEGQVREELMEWWGQGVKDWKHLRTDLIRCALPQELKPFEAIAGVEEKGFQVFFCGDHTTTGSIQGALTSGRQAAQRIVSGRRSEP
jgi:flavin-dependent amine oxidoreductase